MTQPDSFNSPPPPERQMVRVSAPIVRPRLTYLLVGITIFVYLLQLASQPVLQVDLPLVLFAKVNEYIRAGQFWRLITPILVHGSLMHIAFNMYALFILGSDLESVMGYKRFMLLYLLAGFSGNVLSFLLSDKVSVGASTSIFGMIAAQGIFLYQNRTLLPNASNALKRLGSVLLVNLVISLSPGIDLWGHLGGLFGGAVFAWFAGPRWILQGIFPNLQVIDQHGSRDVIVGLLVVLLIFSVLAILGMGLL
jgi:rhomboid protease GluP